MHKNEYRPPDRSRKQRFLTQEEIESGKKGKWTELEITGKFYDISSKFYKLFRTSASIESGPMELATSNSTVSK